jgi:uncharacterized protein (TIGR03086 family)
MSLPAEPAARHRAVAGTFTDRVLGTPDWDVPAPVEGWTARDVVSHLIDWSSGFLAGSGIDLARGSDVVDDPVTAWQVHTEAVQALLDDEGTAARPLANPHIGEMPLAVAIDRIYTSDVFLHTWDLSRATGQDERLDEDTCAVLLDGMVEMEDAIRSSGQYGDPVPVSEDADARTRLLGFIGRDPAWRRGRLGG